MLRIQLVQLEQRREEVEATLQVLQFPLAHLHRSLSSVTLALDRPKDTVQQHQVRVHGGGRQRSVGRRGGAGPSPPLVSAALARHP